MWNLIKEKWEKAIKRNFSNKLFWSRIFSTKIKHCEELLKTSSSRFLLILFFIKIIYLSWNLLIDFNKFSLFKWNMFLIVMLLKTVMLTLFIYNVLSILYIMHRFHIFKYFLVFKKSTFSLKSNVQPFSCYYLNNILPFLEILLLYKKILHVNCKIY